MKVAQVLSDRDIAFVADLARQAGRLALKMRSTVEAREKTGPHDIVTDADLALSQMIVKQLRERFSQDAIVSEEDEEHAMPEPNGRVWLVDPIDGTDNYMANDGQYSVMIGLIDNLKPVYGWVFAPATDALYSGGPQYGTFKKNDGESVERLNSLAALAQEGKARVMMGFRDRKLHPWVQDHPQVTFIKAGSVGLKVAKILEGDADLFVHLAGKLKIWDTAAPVAIALGAGLDVGSLEKNELTFPLPAIVHGTTTIIGRPGSLLWARQYLQQQVK